MPGPSWRRWSCEVVALRLTLAAASNHFTTVNSNGWCSNAEIVQIDDVTVESSVGDCETRCATEPGSCKGYSYAPGDGGSCDSIQTAFPGSCYLWSGACGFTTEKGACWSNHFLAGTGTLSHEAAASATRSTTTTTAATTTTTSTSRKSGTTSNRPGQSTAEIEEVTTTPAAEEGRGTSGATETNEKATTSQAVTATKMTTTANEVETETSTTEASTTITAGWSLRHSQSSCMNMASIKLGDAVVVDTAGLCAQRCQDAEGCVGFGFQSGEQAECTNGGGPKGSCYLWRSSCMIEPNQCWDQYIMGSLALCTSLSCPSGYGLKKQEPPLQCAGSVCDLEVDKATCCAPNFMCSTLSCPSGYTSRAQASDKLCKEQVCTAENDLDTCCQPVVSCSTLACPTGFRLRSNADSLMCGSNPCDPDTDWAACCQQQAKCSTFTCLAGYAGRPNAESLYCQDATCTEADNDRCCIERGDEQLIAKGQHPIPSSHAVGSGQNASSKAALTTASSQTGNDAANCPATSATCDMTGLEPPFTGQEIGAFDVLLCPGQCILGRVYGMQVYTQSSLVCKAAVFSGVISSGGGYIKVRLAPGLPMYDGGLRNGVETFDHGATNTSIVISVPSLEDFCASRAITTTTDMPWGLPWWAWFLICCMSTFLMLLLCWLAMKAMGGGGDDAKKKKKKDQDRREKEAKKSRHRHRHHRDDSEDDYYLEADPVYSYRRTSFEPPPPSNVNPPWSQQEARSQSMIVPHGPQPSGYTTSSPQIMPAYGSTSIQYPGGGAPVPIRPVPNASGSRRSSWGSGAGQLPM